jgi:hypothetical protein
MEVQYSQQSVAVAKSRWSDKCCGAKRGSRLLVLVVLDGKVLAVNASNINLANNYFAAMGLAIYLVIVGRLEY